MWPTFHLTTFTLYLYLRRILWQGWFCGASDTSPQIAHHLLRPETHPGILVVVAWRHPPPAPIARPTRRFKWRNVEPWVDSCSHNWALQFVLFLQRMQKGGDTPFFKESPRAKWEHSERMVVLPARVCSVCIGGLRSRSTLLTKEGISCKGYQRVQTQWRYQQKQHQPLKPRSYAEESHQLKKDFNETASLNGCTPITTKHRKNCKTAPGQRKACFWAVLVLHLIHFWLHNLFHEFKTRGA